MGHSRQVMCQETSEVQPVPASMPAADTQALYGNAFAQQQLGGQGAPRRDGVCAPGQEGAEQAERARQATRRAEVQANDERLAALQRSSAESFARDIHDPAHGHPGVHENGADDRGTEVDAWNREAGVEQGSMWCGTSVGHHYRQGTQGGFQDNLRVAADNRARNYFLYHRDHEEARPNETPQQRDARIARNRRADADEAATRRQHAEDGSNRRYMTYRPGQPERGPVPGGGRPEVYGDASRMPVRSGDTVVFSHRWRPEGERDIHHGHVAMTEGAPDADGNVTIIEGNAGGRPGSNQVQRRVVNVRSPEIDGFGRPALGDMTRGRR